MATKPPEDPMRAARVKLFELTQKRDRMVRRHLVADQDIDSINVEIETARAEFVDARNGVAAQKNQAPEE